MLFDSTIFQMVAYCVVLHGYFQVPTPRKGDRRDIIQYYLQKVACRNINVDVLVHMTAGWNGARLENLLNWVGTSKITFQV